jgi:hypothetical protein
MTKRGLVVALCPSLGATGFRLQDRSGRNNHGTLTNMASTAWTTSGGKGALSFDGANDNVTTNVPGVITVGRAVSVWFLSSATYSNGNYGFLVRWGTAANFPADSGKDFSVAFGTDANFGNSGIGISQYGDSVGVTGFNDGNWHHGVFMSFGTLYSIFVDGLLRNTKTMVTNATAGVVSIGTAYGGFFFNGQLDDMRIYNRALTAPEVRQLYIGGRGFGLLPERPRHRSKAAAAAFKAYWARRQSQLIGGGV